MHETIRGWSHVAITVTDLPRALLFYSDVLGFGPLLAFATDDFDRRVVAHPSGVVVALTAHRATAADEAFDPTRAGLDHLSLRVGDVEDLHAWASHLDTLGVPHGDVHVTERLGSAQLAMWDPDGIQVELYVQLPAT